MSNHEAMKKQKAVNVTDLFLKEIVETEPSTEDTVKYEQTAGEKTRRDPLYPSFGALFREIVDEVKNGEGDINTI